MQCRGQFRLVEVTVVVDPALDVRSEHPRQILQGFVGPMVQRPPPDRLPNHLQRLRTSRWQEGSAIATAMPDRSSRAKSITEKVKRLDRKVVIPVRILTIDELRLRRMKNQPTGPEADLQGIPEPASFCFASAVADDVVGVSLERDGGETSPHPPVKSIVQEQISQDGADHPSLRCPCPTRDDAAVLHFDGSFEPALNIEKHPRAIRMVANCLEQQRPIDAVKIALNVNIEHPVEPPAALSGLPEGVDRRSAGAVSVGVIVEDEFQDGLQIPFDDFLCDPVTDRWDAQRPGPAIAFGKVNPPHWRRKVAP